MKKNVVDFENDLSELFDDFKHGKVGITQVNGACRISLRMERFIARRLQYNKTEQPNKKIDFLHC